MNAQSQRIDGLVTTQVLFDFAQATKAMWRDIRFGDDPFDETAAINYISFKLGVFAREAEAAGPLKVDQYPLPNAIAYVKRYVGEGTSRTAAEYQAEALYDLDAEAMRLLRRNLNEAGVETETCKCRHFDDGRSCEICAG